MIDKKSVGFNMKFRIETEYIQEIVDEMFDDYINISDIVQIKFKTLRKALEFQKQTINRINYIYKGRIIIHLMTKNIDDKRAEEELYWFSKNCSSDSEFLVHLKDDFSVDRIKYLGSLLKGNQKLLLENDSSIKNKKEYIEKLNCFLKENRNLNIKICLDFGHLLFGENYKSQKDILTYIEYQYYYMENIGLFHLHDFDNKKDHLSILSGKLNYLAVKEFISKKENVPIILEVTLKDRLECFKEIEKLFSVL